MTTTLQELRNIWYSILREEEDTSAYPLVLMDMLINSAQNRICNGTIINPFTKEAVRKWKLSFLDTSEFYSNVNVTTLSSDATVWWITLDITDTTGYPNSWKIYINGNIITYTAKTATQFTGVTGIEFAHKSGSQVSIIFALPTDYGSMINITYANSFKLPQKLYDDIYEDLNWIKWQFRTDAQWYRSQWTLRPFYTIIWDYFIIFNRNNTWDQIHIRYEKKATKLVNTTDITTIPEDYAESTIPYLAIWEMLYNRWEEVRASEILNFAIGQVREMYAFYNNANYESINWVQYKTAKSNLNI